MTRHNPFLTHELFRNVMHFTFPLSFKEKLSSCELHEDIKRRLLYKMLLAEISVTLKDIHNKHFRKFFMWLLTVLLWLVC